MRNAQIAFITVVMLCGGTALARPAWVQVVGPFNRPPGQAKVFTTWGHYLPLDDPINAERIRVMRHIMPDGKSVDLPVDNVSGWHFTQVNCARPGVHGVTLTMKPGYAIVYFSKSRMRVRHHPGTLADLPPGDIGRILVALRYQKWCKALLNIGPVARGSTQPFGLGLEIVPEKEISLVAPGETLAFRVLFNGKLLSEPAVASATWLGYSTAPDDFLVSKCVVKDGRFSLKVTRAAIWYVKVNFYRPAPKSEQAKCRRLHYETTLAFEISKPLRSPPHAIAPASRPAGVKIKVLVKPLPHRVVLKDGKPVALMMYSKDFAPETHGFNGHVPVEVVLSMSGKILTVKLLEGHTETPGFYAKVTASTLLGQLVGKCPSDQIEIGEDIDAVTGATLTSRGIVDAVRLTARRAAKELLPLYVSASVPQEGKDMQ